MKRKHRRVETKLPVFPGPSGNIDIPYFYGKLGDWEEDDIIEVPPKKIKE